MPLKFILIVLAHMKTGGCVWACISALGEFFFCVRKIFSCKARVEELLDIFNKFNHLPSTHESYREEMLFCLHVLLG